MTFNHRNVAADQYLGILNSGKFTDTEILVGEEPKTKVFKAHALILKIRSSYFCQELSSNKIKIENNVIKCKKSDISVETFDVLLRYMYSAMINISKNNIKTNIEILIAVHKLGIKSKSLSNDIMGYIFDDVNSLKKNFVLVQHVATNYSHFTKLSQFYKKTFQENPSLIFEADDFITIKENVLLGLVKENRSLKAIEIWNKLAEWAIAQSSELSSDTKKWTPNEMMKFGTVLRPFIPHINFKEITPSEFCQKIKPFKGIFDNDFYIQILEYYASNEEAHLKFGINLMNIDSRIINSDQAHILCNLIKIAKKDDRNALYDLKLLVRGSRDGFDIETFHELCDEKGPTIVISSVKDSYEILGGFNPIFWTSKARGVIRTAESFIFSLGRELKFTFSKISGSDSGLRNAIRVGSDAGPWFGISDLQLLVNISNSDSTIPKGHSCIGSYGRVREFGHKGVFDIDDYEVFQVLSAQSHD